MEVDRPKIEIKIKSPGLFPKIIFLEFFLIFFLILSFFLTNCIICHRQRYLTIWKVLLIQYAFSMHCFICYVALQFYSARRTKLCGALELDWVIVSGMDVGWPPKPLLQPIILLYALGA